MAWVNSLWWRSIRAPFQDMKDVWISYKTNPNESDRNILLENYLSLVRYNAERIHSKLPPKVDVEDLMSAGIFGLMGAIDAFDLGRGVKFETYCAPRIRGAILDELRELDWVPRLVRSRASQVGRARKKLILELGRPPTDEELIKKFGVSEDEFLKIRDDAHTVGTISLSRKWFETDSNKEVREIDVLKDERQENPLTIAQRDDLKSFIIRDLSHNERVIIILYYYEQMVMAEIGVILDLSQSRISKMHRSILVRLKAVMVKVRPLD